MPIENSLAIFSYLGHDVRTLMVNGQPWFVAADIARLLGYSATSAMTRSLENDERGVRTLHTPSGDQEMLIVSESGLYAAILRSTIPQAKEFRRWVTGVVLPEIRQTGVFALIPTKPSAPELPADYLAALKALVVEVEHSTELRAELAEVMPRAEAWDALASAEGDFSVGDAAKVLARDGILTGPARLFGQLANLKWIYRGADNEWHAYADRVERGYLAEKLSYRYHPGTGERIVNTPQVRVTVKGIDRLRLRLHSTALQAVSA